MVMQTMWRAKLTPRQPAAATIGSIVAMHAAGHVTSTVLLLPLHLSMHLPLSPSPSPPAHRRLSVHLQAAHEASRESLAMASPRRRVTPAEPRSQARSPSSAAFGGDRAVVMLLYVNRSVFLEAAGERLAEEVRAAIAAKIPVRASSLHLREPSAHFSPWGPRSLTWAMPVSGAARPPDRGLRVQLDPRHVPARPHRSGPLSAAGGRAAPRPTRGGERRALRQGARRKGLAAQIPRGRRAAPAHERGPPAAERDARAGGALHEPIAAIAMPAAHGGGGRRVGRR